MEKQLVRVNVVELPRQTHDHSDDGRCACCNRTRTSSRVKVINSADGRTCKVYVCSHCHRFYLGPQVGESPAVQPHVAPDAVTSPGSSAGTRTEPFVPLTLVRLEDIHDQQRYHDKCCPICRAKNYGPVSVGSVEHGLRLEGIQRCREETCRSYFRLYVPPDRGGSGLSLGGF